MKKRCFALLLALIMLVSVFPVGAFAQENAAEGKDEEKTASDVTAVGDNSSDDLTEEEPGEDSYIYRELKEAGDEEAIEAFLQSLTDAQREALKALDAEEEIEEEAPSGSEQTEDGETSENEDPD